MPRGGPRKGAGRKAGVKSGPTAKTKARRRAIKRHQDLTADRTIEEIRRVALSDIGFLYDEQGRFKPLRDIPPEHRACIASVKTTKQNLTSGDGKQEDVIEVKLWNKVGALDLAARHHGLLIEKLEVSGAVTLLEKITQARQRLAAARSAHS
jgi:hypothetical protein